MSKRVLKGKKYELYCRVSWNNIAKVCLLPGKSMFFGFWSKAWNIPNWHFPPLSLMWFGVDNKKTKQSKFEPFVDNNRGIQLFHLFHQQHHCHQHKLPHHHLPILSGRVCYLISSSAMSVAVSPHVLLLRTARSILIFLTSLSLTSCLAPHFFMASFVSKKYPS